MALLPYRCLSCSPKTRFYSEPPAEGMPVCPECGSKRRVHALVVIHHLKPDPDGPIPGSEHAAHERYSIACGIPYKGAGQMTDHLPAATCYECTLPKTKS